MASEHLGRTGVWMRMGCGSTRSWWKPASLMWKNWAWLGWCPLPALGSPELGGWNALNGPMPQCQDAAPSPPLTSIGCGCESTSTQVIPSLGMNVRYGSVELPGAPASLTDAKVRLYRRVAARVCSLGLVPIKYTELKLVLTRHRYPLPERCHCTIGSSWV